MIALRRLVWFAVGNVLGLLAAVWLIGSVHASSLLDIVIAGLVLSVLNALVRPVVKALALPLIVVTMGLVAFLINLVMIAITGALVKDLEISGFGALVKTTFIVWVVNLVVDHLPITGRPGRK
ncbi:MAG TPA: phage holin family protein [Candidatus Dormibacteraeota bacterium]